MSERADRPRRPLWDGTSIPADYEARMLRASARLTALGREQNDDVYAAAAALLWVLAIEGSIDSTTAVSIKAAALGVAAAVPQE